MTEVKNVPEQVDSNIAPVEETPVEQIEEVEDVVEETPAEPIPEPVKTEPVKERPVYSMPVHKHVEETKTLKEKHAQREAELLKEIENLKAQPVKTASQQEEIDEEVRATAEKYNLEPSALLDIINLTSKRAGAPNKEVAELLQQTKVKQMQEEVKSDFDAKVLPLIQKDFPDADAKFVSNLKQQITDLAFSQGYNTLPVEDIYFINKGKGAIEFKNNYTAEPTGGKGSEHKNFTTMSEKEALKLPPQDYLKWSDLQAKKQSRWND